MGLNEIHIHDAPYKSHSASLQLRDFSVLGDEKHQQRNLECSLELATQLESSARRETQTTVLLAAVPSTRKRKLTPASFGQSLKSPTTVSLPPFTPSI